MTHQDALKNMVKQQLRTGDVLNDNILSLFDEFPRDQFVPDGMQQFAYSDLQIPLAHQQRMMTPLEEGKILQSLQLQKKETVLEIGTGTGYLTALLSRLAKTVISIDYFKTFTQLASVNLRKHNCHNVELITGDGCGGWFNNAPFDVVILTGSIEALTDSHRLQVLPGGKLVAIIGREPIMQCRLFKLDHHDMWTEDILFETSLPPLIDKLKLNDFVF
jgi:protein-L-isoaspartate(D-aspartate) O-methyltransferase